MSELASIIQGRRSVRSYENRPVRDEDLAKILDALRWAPSWANTQCWEVVVVKDEAVKQNLQASLPPKGNPAAKAMVQAPVVVAMCAKMKSSGFFKDQASTKFGEWMMYDLGLATQNLCLTAHDLGLGTVVVGLFDHEKAANALAVPPGYELVALIPMGYPAKESSAPKRREVTDFTHYDRW